MVRYVKFCEVNMKKKKILIFIDWFLPGYKAGGPIQSISNFVNHFGTVFDISIITSNKDLGLLSPMMVLNRMFGLLEIIIELNI